MIIHLFSSTCFATYRVLNRSPWGACGHGRRSAHAASADSYVARRRQRSPPPQTLSIWSPAALCTRLKAPSRARARSKRRPAVQACSDRQEAPGRDRPPCLGSHVHAGSANGPITVLNSPALPPLLPPPQPPRASASPPSKLLHPRPLQQSKVGMEAAMKVAPDGGVYTVSGCGP